MSLPAAGERGGAVIPLTAQQRQSIAGLRRWWDESPYHIYERTIQNARGEVRVEYRHTNLSQEWPSAVLIYPNGEENFCGRATGSRGAWKPSELREVPEEELAL